MPIAIHHDRAFQPPFGVIKRTPTGATRRIGKTPIDRHIVRIEADDPVILVQPIAQGSDAGGSRGG